MNAISKIWIQKRRLLLILVQTKNIIPMSTHIWQAKLTLLLEYQLVNGLVLKTISNSTIAWMFKF